MSHECFNNGNCSDYSHCNWNDYDRQPHLYQTFKKVTHEFEKAVLEASVGNSDVIPGLSGKGLKSTGNETADSISIGVTAYDKNGDIIRTEKGYANADNLKPGQKSTFEVNLWKDNFKGMKKYELSLEWGDEGTYGENEFAEDAQIYDSDNNNSTNSNFANSPLENDIHRTSN